MTQVSCQVMVSLTGKEKLGKLGLWNIRSFISDTFGLRKQQNIQLEMHIRTWEVKRLGEETSLQVGVAKQDICPEPLPFLTSRGPGHKSI